VTPIVCYDADYYPYGGEKVYANTCPQNYKFEGKERDTETGNDDFGARYYSSVYGRFLSADWSAIPVPVPYANLTNPQTLNLYAIVHDNPETFVDLDGHCFWDGCIVEAVAVGLVINWGINRYSDWIVTKAKSEDAAAARKFELACAASSSCDINTVHQQTVATVQDALTDAAGTAIKTTPQTPIPTDAPGLIIDGVMDQLKDKAVDSAKEQQRQQQQRQQQQQQQKQPPPQQQQQPPPQPPPSSAPPCTVKSPACGG
jgi:RHS repeat-associated protein